MTSPDDLRASGSLPVYLDHAATTPMHPAAIEAMTSVLATVGNASSLHGTGRTARRRMEEAREALAKLLGARPSEVIFTAGGTESDNLAVKGIYWARRDGDPRRRRIVTTGVEHHAVLDAVEWLVDHEGADVTWLPVEADGSVSPSALRDALADHDDVALVTVMWANNEVGTIMPIAKLAAIAAEFDIPMHSDAVQAVGQIPVDFNATRTVGDEHRRAQVRWTYRCRGAAVAPRHGVRSVAAWRWSGTRCPFGYTRCRRRRRDGRRSADSG